MTKEVATTENKSVSLATDQLPDFLREQSQGRGYSKEAADNIIPLIGILDAKSPQLNPRKPEYIEGAKAGDIVLSNAPVPFVSGQEGFVFQPCGWVRTFTEWTPRDAGGGFIGMYPELPADAVLIEDPNPNKKKWTRNDGKTEVVEQRNQAGYVIFPDGSAFPYVIPFKSTGHTVHKAWNSAMLGRQLDVWLCLYRLKTRERTNAKGTFFVFNISPAGFIHTQDEFERGRSLYEAFATGEKVADVDAMQSHPDDEGDEDSAVM